jgi:hypothetical protein
MSDYQAIYDAVRSRISGGNLGEAVAELAMRAFDEAWAERAELPRKLAMMSADGGKDIPL